MIATGDVPREQRNWPVDAVTASLKVLEASDPEHLERVICGVHAYSLALNEEEIGWDTHRLHQTGCTARG